MLSQSSSTSSIRSAAESLNSSSRRAFVMSTSLPLLSAPQQEPARQPARSPPANVHPRPRRFSRKLASGLRTRRSGKLSQGQTGTPPTRQNRLRPVGARGPHGPAGRGQAHASPAAREGRSALGRPSRCFDLAAKPWIRLDLASNRAGSYGACTAGCGA
jgi:hypothetical protein